MIELDAMLEIIAKISFRKFNLRRNGKWVH